MVLVVEVVGVGGPELVLVLVLVFELELELVGGPELPRLHSGAASSELPLTNPHLRKSQKSNSRLLLPQPPALMLMNIFPNPY